MAAKASLPQKSDHKKRVVLMRHGESLAQTSRQHGIDRYHKQFLDCHLSRKGVHQAREAWHGRRAELPDLIVVSPLTRALATALLCFGDVGKEIPMICHPAIKETGTDIPENVARPLSDLRRDSSLTVLKGFEDIDFQLLPEDWPAQQLAGQVDGRGFSQFIRWLGQRPEQYICVVCHHNVILELASVHGRVRNCAPIECSLDGSALKVAEGSGMQGADYSKAEKAKASQKDRKSAPKNKGNKR